MLQVETTTILDATKYLPCESCVNNYSCKRYMLICDFTKQKLFFAANLLCILECAEELAITKQVECVRKNYSHTSLRAEQAFKIFLPAVNNALQAFYKYDCEHASDYAKQALIFALASTLENWNCLEYFDFMFSQDVENTRDILQAQFEYEITKSEKQKVAKQNTSENNTKKGE